MLDSLPGLITKRARGGMRQTTLYKTVGRPASVVESKPNEEHAFQGSPTLPDSLPRSKPDSTDEGRLIGRFAAVAAILTEATRVLVRNSRIQDHIIHQTSNGQIFKNHLDS